MTFLLSFCQDELTVKINQGFYEKSSIAKSAGRLLQELGLIPEPADTVSLLEQYRSLERTV